MDRSYDEALKESAVSRVAAGEPPLKVAREMQIPRTTLLGWVEKFEQGGGLVLDAGDVAIQRRREHLIAGYFEISGLAQDLLREGLTKVTMEKVTVRDLQSIAVIAGISSQRAQDLDEGRAMNPERPGVVTVNVVWQDRPTAAEEERLALEEGRTIDSTARRVEPIPVVWEDKPRANG